jgi:Tol biopolymer transport system component
MLKDPSIEPPVNTPMGSTEALEITFPIGINTDSVESRLSFEPAQSFSLEWKESTLYIHPEKAFYTENKLELRLKSGAMSLDGRKYSKDFSRVYTIRQPGIVYLGNVTSSPELWVFHPETKASSQLTFTGGYVTDFAASPRGNGILFTRKNTTGGADVYWLLMQSGEPQILVDCGKETCADPAVSPDGTLFAFSRNRDPENAEAAATSKFSYIFTGVVAEGEKSVTPLITEKNISGSLPSFSPDGTKISFYDAISKGIRIVNKDDGNDFLLGTNRLQRGSWSADGKYMIFVDDEESQEKWQSRLYMLDLENSSINEPVKDLLEGLELGEPDLSPDGTTIVTGVRSMDSTLTRQMVVFDLTSHTRTNITDDHSVMSAAPKWRMDGKFIVFQQAQLSKSSAKPVIALWDAEKNTITVIAEDAALPEWLP